MTISRLLRPFAGGSGGVPALVVATLLLSGCATKGDIRNVEVELATLTGRLDSLTEELRRQGRITVDTLRTQSDRLVDLRGNIQQTLREVEGALDRIEALAGQNSRDIANIRTQVAELRRSVRSGVPVAGTGPVGAERAGDESVESVYQDAMRAHTRGSLRTAELGFQAFLRRFPNDEEYTPLAHFNLGDVYQQQERYDEAVEEFLRLHERFPASVRVPEALYRVGMIHLEHLDDAEEGCRYLGIVVNSYEESAPYELARREMDDRCESTGV